MQRLAIVVLLLSTGLALERTLLQSRAICTKGAHIYTSDPAQDVVECISYRGRHLTSLGPRYSLPRLARLRVQTLPEGQIVLPGLTDAHAHLLEYGEGKAAVDLRSARSAAEAANLVQRYVEDGKASDENAVILGLGWDQTDWPGKAFPTADDLEIDELRGRSILLKRVDFHAGWVSRTLLKQLQPLPDHIEGGQIVRNEAGQATGVFLDAALEYVYEKLPSWTDAQRQHYLEVASADLLALGIVGVHDAKISLATADFYRRHVASLPLRIYGMVDCLNNRYCGDEVDALHGERFTLRTAKIFADGALGSFGAALHEPYSDMPSSRGILRSPAHDFKPLVEQWVAKGFQVAGHAIGDRANTIMVDAFESALKNETHPASKRLRIEHAQIIRPNDVERMTDLGVIASMQPTHATSDMRYAESRLGPERIKTAYAWQSVLQRGVHLPLSSDFPVEPISPWRGIYAAVTRLDPDTQDSPHGRGGWYPAERLTRAQALAGFTSEAAYASFSETWQGSLTVGKVADFIVVDRDVMHIQAEDILATRVLATVIDGRVVHGAIK